MGYGSRFDLLRRESPAASVETAGEPSFYNDCIIENRSTPACRHIHTHTRWKSSRGGEFALTKRGNSIIE